MELNVLRIDLDVTSESLAKIYIIQRLTYLNQFFLVDSSFIKKIELIKKKNYSAKIYLNNNVEDFKTIIILQLIFGSDWRKEINTFYNHRVLNMDYSNRLFTIKNYKGDFKKAEIIDVTREIFQEVYKK